MFIPYSSTEDLMDYNIYTYKSLTGGKYKVIDVISVGAGTRYGIPR